MPELIEEVHRKHPDQQVQVWFEDEARFGQQGTLARVWASVGSRPRAVGQTQYEYPRVPGACCPATGQTVGLLSPHITTRVMNAFFGQFIQEVDPQIHVVLIWDGAGCHKSRELKLPANVTVIPLPPYSPELNPMENLWHYPRSHHGSNRVYEDYDALRQAGCDAWQKACLNPDLVKTVCRASYAEQRR